MNVNLYSSSEKCKKITGDEGYIKIEEQTKPFNIEPCTKKKLIVLNSNVIPAYKLPPSNQP